MSEQQQPQKKGKEPKPEQQENQRAAADDDEKQRTVESYGAFKAAAKHGTVLSTAGGDGEGIVASPVFPMPIREKADADINESLEGVIVAIESNFVPELHTFIGENDLVSDDYNGRHPFDLLKEKTYAQHKVDELLGKVADEDMDDGAADEGMDDEGDLGGGGGEANGKFASKKVVYWPNMWWSGFSDNQWKATTAFHSMFLLSVANNQIGRAAIEAAKKIEDGIERDSYVVPTIASKKESVMQAFQNSVWARYGPIRLNPFNELTAIKHMPIGRILGFKDAEMKHAMLLMRDARRVFQSDLLERFERWTKQGGAGAGAGAGGRQPASVLPTGPILEGSVNIAALAVPLSFAALMGFEHALAMESEVARIRDRLPVIDTTTTDPTKKKRIPVKYKAGGRYADVFPADASGSFEAEYEDTTTAIAESNALETQDAPDDRANKKKKKTVAGGGASSPAQRQSDLVLDEEDDDIGMQDAPRLGGNVQQRDDDSGDSDAPSEPIPRRRNPVSGGGGSGKLKRLRRKSTTIEDSDSDNDSDETGSNRSAASTPDTPSPKAASPSPSPQAAVAFVRPSAPIVVPMTITIP